MLNQAPYYPLPEPERTAVGKETVAVYLSLSAITALQIARFIDKLYRECMIHSEFYRK